MTGVTPYSWPSTATRAPAGVERTRIRPIDVAAGVAIRGVTGSRAAGAADGAAGAGAAAAAVAAGFAASGTALSVYSRADAAGAGGSDGTAAGDWLSVNPFQ